MSKNNRNLFFLIYYFIYIYKWVGIRVQEKLEEIQGRIVEGHIVEEIQGHIVDQIVEEHIVEEI